MDALLSRFGVQALNYAIKSGIVLTSNYAIGQCSRLLKTVDDRNTRVELKRLQRLISSKVKIISSAISLIELKAGRGNPLLEGALPLARSLHRDIVRLGRRLDHVATAEEHLRRMESRAGVTVGLSAELMGIIADMKALLARIDRDTPSLQLAISVSGESLSTSLPHGISPSRLLQSSILLTMGDTQFAQDPSRPVQIGPSFTVALYMLFLGHAANPPSHHYRSSRGDPDINTAARDDHSPGTSSPSDEYGIGEGARKPLWQEVMHKARVRICRTPATYTFDHIQGFVPPERGSRSSPEGANDNWHDRFRDDYAYHIEIIEDLDDGRVHDDGDDPYGGYDTVGQAGIRESIPVYQISKLFYTDTGRMLNIGNSIEVESNPVLLLKRDVNAPRPSGMGDLMAQHWGGGGGEERAGGGVHPLPGPSVHDADGSDSDLEVDRQLREECEAVGVSPDTNHQAHSSTSASYDVRHKLRFPRHLDPEWIALEAFEDNDTSSTSSDHGGTEHDDDEGPGDPPMGRMLEYRSPLDSRLIAQIKTLSLNPAANPHVEFQQPTRHIPQDSGASNHPSQLRAQDELGLNSTSPPQWDDNVEHEHQPSFVARSPFDAITTSLSLMEMLIRLTGLQQFQQANHLSIPDYMLTFFLEETSTTGLEGEAGWRVRHEAKTRVGFDPYTDTLPKPRAPAEDF